MQRNKVIRYKLVPVAKVDYYLNENYDLNGSCVVSESEVYQAMVLREREIMQRNKIIRYKLIPVEKVDDYLNENFDLHGSCVVYESEVYQAMVLREEPEL